MRYGNNGKAYKLVEFNGDLKQDEIACDHCALSDLCDSVADNLNDIEYLLCEEDEDILDDFDNPIYVECEE